MHSLLPLNMDEAGRLATLLLNPEASPCDRRRAAKLVVGKTLNEAMTALMQHKKEAQNA